MIGIIAAVSMNGIIGVKDSNGNGKLPFYYKEDLKNFKNKTLNSVVIMGRKTYESIGKPLSNRDNFIITSSPINNLICFSSIKEALENTKDKNVWFIGGSLIYQEAMNYADEIHLTLTPDFIYDKNSNSFPFINPLLFEIKSISNLSENLKLAIYKKI